MPGNVRPVTDERDGLLTFLAQQRDALRFSLVGLTEEQAWSTPSASALSLAGLVKHVAYTERAWVVERIAELELPKASVEERAGEYEQQFSKTEGDTIDSVLALLAEVAGETERIVGEIDDMDRPVPVPKDVPWFPKDIDAWSVRWVLLHLIEETARHAGHADVIRESIDGKSALQLMAEAEGWADQLAQWMTPDD